MRIYCINLKRSPERRVKMEQELKKLSLDYEFIDAIDGRLISIAARNAAYCSWRTRLRHGKNLTPGELGCVLSHLKFFRKIIETNEVGFVLEDDVAFLDGAHAAVAEVDAFLKNAKGPTLVQLPGIERDLRCDENGDVGFIKVQSSMGTYAYGVNPEAAKLLLKVYTPIMMPIDKYEYIIKHFGLNFFVYPKIVLKVDMENSLIGAERFQKLSGCRKLFYKIWRCIGLIVDAILTWRTWR